MEPSRACVVENVEHVGKEGSLQASLVCSSVDRKARKPYKPCDASNDRPYAHKGTSSRDVSFRYKIICEPSYE